MGKTLAKELKETFLAMQRFRKRRRKPIGLFKSLTPKQLESVLNYTGPENHGDPPFKRRH